MSKVNSQLVPHDTLKGVMIWLRKGDRVRIFKGEDRERLGVVRNVVPTPHYVDGGRAIDKSEPICVKADGCTVAWFSIDEVWFVKRPRKGEPVRGVSKREVLQAKKERSRR